MDIKVELIMFSLFCVLAANIIKAVSMTDYSRTIYTVKAIASLTHLYVLKFAFRYKVKSLLLLNQLLHSCRMYQKKPKKVEALCYLCNMRGGYLRCRRSRQLKVS